MAGQLRSKLVDVTNEVGGKALQRMEGWVLRYSEVDTTPFLSQDGFPWIKQLEDGFDLIRAELDAVLEYRDELPNFQDISTDQLALTHDDKWKTYFFFGYGFKSDTNCARCPETTKLLEQIPDLTTAFFSILSPHKKIPPHRGPWRGVLRYHLALKIPEPADRCGISVGDEVAHWVEGKSLLFDDGYEHYAWNDTDDFRVVLFMDVLRPLRGVGGWANKALIKAIAFSPFVRDGKARHLDWEKRFEAMRNR
ncbi:MAG: ornithine lipid ester-linked acyl 2-hydroxylase [Acidimicrobiaceae bacterium]|jgi:aspartyl/asparaginyl beta-hydroxylase (cupin superfamily)|nr:ornithine lipid ester-linked acyl 2-hydroxylase [Acidimicrobiaceae bacterium]